MMRLVVALLLGLAACPGLSVEARAEAPRPEDDAAKREAGPKDMQPAALVGDLSTDYSYQSLGGQRANAFEIRRAELGLLRAGEEHPFGGEILFEAIRSAGPDSFSGIDVDSLVVRLKRAWGYARGELGPARFEGRFGLIPTPWVDESEADSELRFLEQLSAQRQGVYLGSDQGASVRSSLWNETLVLHLAVLNGEGRNRIEQNRGKNSQLLVSAQVWKGRLRGREARLRLHAGGQEGSSGPSAAAAHRASIGVSAVHEELALGLEVHHLFGVADVSSRESRVVGAWCRARWQFLQGVFRYDHNRQDLKRANTTSQLLMAGLFGMHERANEVYRLGLVGRFEFTDSSASPIPGYSSAGSLKALLLMFSMGVGQ